MQPNSLDHHFATSVGKRDIPKCSYLTPLISFSSLPSHTQRDVTSSTSLLQGKVWALGKVKSRPFEEEVTLWNPVLSLPPLDRSMCEVTPSQTKMHAFFLFLRKESFTVFTCLTDQYGASHETRKSSECRRGLYVQCIGFKGTAWLPN